MIVWSRAADRGCSAGRGNPDARMETTVQIGIAAGLALVAGVRAAEAPGSKTGVGAAADAPRVPVGFRLAVACRVSRGGS